VLKGPAYTYRAWRCAGSAPEEELQQTSRAPCFTVILAAYARYARLLWWLAEPGTISRTGACMSRRSIFKQVFVVAGVALGMPQAPVWPVALRRILLQEGWTLLRAQGFVLCRDAGAMAWRAAATPGHVIPSNRLLALAPELEWSHLVRSILACQLRLPRLCERWRHW